MQEPLLNQCIQSVTMFDPYALPIPDLGLMCQNCGYPLANLTEHRCSECGHPVDMDAHIPEGAFPLLIAGGETVKDSPEVRELFEAYHIPIMVQNDPLTMVFGEGNKILDRLRPAQPIMVPRDRYFEAIDLIRRWKLDEDLPPPPKEFLAHGPWICQACGEENPETFEVCWSCGAEYQATDEHG